MELLVQVFQLIYTYIYSYIFKEIHETKVTEYYYIITVDRNFGFLDSIFHRISSTHVAHHYFSRMPHYHAEEATIHIKKVLGPYYIFDDTPIIKALWRSHNQCRFIEDEGDIIFYKN